MSGRGLRRVTVAAGVVAVGWSLVACGNQSGGAQAGNVSTTPTPTPTSPTPERSIPQPVKTPTPVPTPTVGPTTRLALSMLLTGSDVAKADPKRGWGVTSAVSEPICGRSSTRGANARGSLTRSFTTELDASGTQWLTRYDDARAAKAAYEQIVRVVTTCKALKPGSTHARKLTENRKLELGDETTILRWYDYPLPNDPGSEDGGFPYAVTRKGNVISVLAFREMGKGIAVAHFEALTRTAAARLR